MECSEDNKDFKVVVKKAYELGLMKGGNRLQRTINKVLENNNKLLNTNRYLAQELLNLNNLSPLIGTPSIVIPLKKAKSISGILPNNHSLQKYLQKLIGEQMSTFVS